MGKLHTHIYYTGELWAGKKYIPKSRDQPIRPAIIIYIWTEWRHLGGGHSCIRPSLSTNRLVGTKTARRQIHFTQSAIIIINYPSSIIVITLRNGLKRNEFLYFFFNKFVSVF